MCTDCLRVGWQGVFKRGKEVIAIMDALPCWAATPGSNTGANMVKRLEDLWNFLRLRLPRHLTTQDSVRTLHTFTPPTHTHVHLQRADHLCTLRQIGAHCMQCRLGSIGNDRLNTACTHGRGDGVVVGEPAEDRTTFPGAPCATPGCTKSGAGRGGGGPASTARSRFAGSTWGCI